MKYEINPTGTRGRKRRKRGFEKCYVFDVREFFIFSSLARTTQHHTTTNSHNEKGFKKRKKCVCTL